ncbi:MAG TPA: folate-binding protein [Burkholderiales bacterium]|nr:folate-binding protein [Burkholderiales bacterium]
MTQSWQAHLAASGATIADARVAHFGDPAAELRAAKSGTIVCDLSHLGVIGFAGADAQSFLQGQVSCDVDRVGAGASTYGSYNTPKGRMLAAFLLWRDADGVLMQLPAELVTAIKDRLAKYVLRARVKVRDASDESVRIGLGGAGARALLENALGGAPGGVHEVAQLAGATVLGLPGGRWEIIAPPDRASALWDTLRAQAVSVGAPCWDWLEIVCGVPAIVPATQDRFVPQMANLDLIGGVSFDKGCYPGQEIVARTRYLGQIKRRMILAHVDAGAPEPGDELFSPGFDGQASGTIVSSAPSPDGGHDVLAVVRIEAGAGGGLRLKSADGPLLELRELPYALPLAERRN